MSFRDSGSPWGFGYIDEGFRVGRLILPGIPFDGGQGLGLSRTLPELRGLRGWTVVKREKSYLVV